MCSLPVAGGEVPQARREARDQWVGGVKIEGGSELGEVLTGTPGLQVRYVYTGRRPERSPYIAERAQSMHSLTRGEMLRSGVCVPYQERCPRGTILRRGTYSRGDQVGKGGVLHRGLVGPSKKRGAGRLALGGAGLGWGVGRKAEGGKRYYLGIRARWGGPPRRGKGAGRAQ